MHKKILLRLLNIGILSLWIMLLFMLVDREVYPITRSQNIISYRHFLPKELLLRDHWMGIYLNDKKVGFSNTTVNAYEEKGFSGYEVRNETEMYIFLFGSNQKVFFKGSALIDTNYNLRNFKIDLKTGAQLMKIEGELLKKNLISLNVITEGSVAKKEVFIPEDIFIANILTPLDFLGKLSPGKSYIIDVLEPFTLTVEKVRLSVKDKVDFMDQLKSVKAYVVEADYKGLRLKSWVSEEGEILREETPLGWVMVKEPMEKAITYQRYLFETQTDVASLISITPSGNIDIPENISYMKIRLGGINASDYELSNERQAVLSKAPLTLEIKTKGISKDSAIELPISAKALEEFMQPSRFIQSDSEEIIRLARSITGGSKNSLIAAQRIKDWVFNNIRKKPVISIPDALGTLKRKEGDCNEHSFLFAALSRAIGIPAKVCYGIVHVDGRFYYHAWCKVYIGEWISMDPTLGEDFADATHVEFLSGGLDKQLDLVRLLGKLNVKILEVK